MISSTICCQVWVPNHDLPPLTGAFTHSFVRAAKYPSEESLEERGARALSLLSNERSLDLVFHQARDRDAVGWWLSQARKLPLSYSVGKAVN